jgi:hypothetical protein
LPELMFQRFVSKGTPRQVRAPTISDLSSIGLSP